MAILYLLILYRKYTINKIIHPNLFYEKEVLA
jgi:hypothetical protein